MVFFTSRMPYVVDYLRWSEKSKNNFLEQRIQGIIARLEPGPSGGQRPPGAIYLAGERLRKSFTRRFLREELLLLFNVWARAGREVLFTFK